MNFKKFLSRFQNAGTIVTVASLIVLILTTNGVQVDNERVMTTVKAVCSIGIVLGILNNPDTPGLDFPGISEHKED